MKDDLTINVDDKGFNLSGSNLSQLLSVLFSNQTIALGVVAALVVIITCYQFFSYKKGSAAQNVSDNRFSLSSKARIHKSGEGDQTVQGNTVGKGAELNISMDH